MNCPVFGLCLGGKRPQGKDRGESAPFHSLVLDHPVVLCKLYPCPDFQIWSASVPEGQSQQLIFLTVATGEGLSVCPAREILSRASFWENVLGGIFLLLCF